MDTRVENEIVKKIAEGLIQKEPALTNIKNSQVRIAYLTSEQEKKSGGNLVYGQCEKVPEKYKWSIPYDFTITVFQPNVERFTDRQLAILVFHELLHIKIECDGNELKYAVRKHDLEDFRMIVDRFGVDWSEHEQA